MTATTTMRFRTVGLGLFVILLAGVYHFLGMSVYVASNHGSAFRHLHLAWSGTTSGAIDYSHAYLIPFVSLYLVWSKRKELQKLRYAAWAPGLLPLGLGFTMHVLGYRAQLPQLSLAVFPLLLWLGVTCLYGRDVARQVLFPCVLLCFCLPLDFLSAATLPLRVMATHVSVAVMQGLCVPCEAAGTAIVALGKENMSLDVADACSGLRSITALTAIATIYGYLSQPTWPRMLICFLSALPLAVVGNIFRVLVVGLSYGYGGRELGDLSHKVSGYLVFIGALVPLLFLGRWLRSLPVKADGHRASGRVAPRTTTFSLKKVAGTIDPMNRSTCLHGE